MLGDRSVTINYVGSGAMPFVVQSYVGNKYRTAKRCVTIDDAISERDYQARHYH